MIHASLATEHILTGLTGITVIILALPLLFVAMRLVGLQAGGLKGLLGGLADIIDATNDLVGRVVSLFALGMVLVQTVVVLQRFVFGLGFIWLQESITYMHGLMFLLAAGYALLHGEHVRVDIFYRAMPARRKALVDFLGCYFLLFPVMMIILYVAFPYVRLAWLSHEGSAETSGIQAIYLLKTSILVFAGLLLAQGLSLAIRTGFLLTGVEQAEPEAETGSPHL